MDLTAAAAQMIHHRREAAECEQSLRDALARGTALPSPANIDAELERRLGGSIGESAVARELARVVRSVGRRPTSIGSRRREAANDDQLALPFAHVA